MTPNQVFNEPSVIIIACVKRIGQTPVMSLRLSEEFIARIAWIHVCKMAERAGLESQLKHDGLCSVIVGYFSLAGLAYASIGSNIMLLYIHCDQICPTFLVSK